MVALAVAVVVASGQQAQSSGQLCGSRMAEASVSGPARTSPGGVVVVVPVVPVPLGRRSVP